MISNFTTFVRFIAILKYIYVAPLAAGIIFLHLGLKAWENKETRLNAVIDFAAAGFFFIFFIRICYVNAMKTADYYKQPFDKNDMPKLEGTF